jgi:hypothetical protein
MMLAICSAMIGLLGLLIVVPPPVGASTPPLNSITMEFSSSPTSALKVEQWTSVRVSNDIPGGVNDPGNNEFYNIGGLGGEEPFSLTFEAPGGSEISAGNIYDTDDGSLAQVNIGTPSTGGCSSDDATIEVDQAIYTSGQLTTLGLQYDAECGAAPAEWSGTVAYNLSPTTPGQGYYTYGDDGSLTGFGNDSYLNYLGDLSTVDLNQPIVGMATTPDGGGYWMVASDGGIFSFGDAGFYGSTGAIRLNKPIVGMATTPDGGGYWMVASDGGIFSFGDAGFYGSTGAIHLNQPIVGMASTPDGKGYWMVASDGGIFSFGDAGFYGSTGAIHLNEPIVGMTSTPDGGGYWLTASDGGIFSFGDAQFAGSLGGLGITNVVGSTH